MSPTALHTALVFPIAWRWPGRAGKMLFEFALAEQATMLDLRAAAAQTTSDERRVAYLRHALDEGRHALVFAQLSRSERARRGLPPVGEVEDADTEQLFARLGELGFLAYVHLGEQRACDEFEVILRWLTRHEPDAPLTGTIRSILRDERQHGSYTHALLVELAGGERSARRWLRQARLRDGWWQWRRAGNRLARALYWLSMLVVYLCAAPLALLVRVVRPVPVGWQRPS